MEQTSGIYKIENKVNGKVYIGQSKHIQKRWNEHKMHLRNNKHYNQYLQHAWNKYGEENFEFSILEECDCDKIDDLEIHHIKEHNSTEKERGYNLQFGGKGEKIRDSQTLIENLRKAHEYEYRPVNQYSFDLQFIKRFDCMTEAARAVEGESSGIRNAAINFKNDGKKSGHNKTFKGFLWVFDEDVHKIKDLDFEYYRFGSCSKFQVNKYEYPSGKYVCTYRTSAYAARDNGVSNDVIWFCVEGSQMQSHGYTYRNADIYPPNQDIYIEPPPVYEPKNVRAVTAYDPKTGEVYKTYSSITKAVEDGFSHHISSCCKGTRKTCGGYAWRYADESDQAS